VAGQGDSSAALDSFSARGDAGDYFFRWLKSRNLACAQGCPKKFSVHKMVVK
jgi:hypothetical protein